MRPWAHFTHDLPVQYDVFAFSLELIPGFHGSPNNVLVLVSIYYLTWNMHTVLFPLPWCYSIRALFQYPIKCLIVRSREVSKPRDWCLKFSDHSKIWQTPRQHCCRCACQIAKRYNILSADLAASRLHEVLRWDVLSDIETGPMSRWIHMIYLLISFRVILLAPRQLHH